MQAQEQLAGHASKTVRDLNLLFDPRSVVVIGVSKDPIKRGRQVIRNVMSGGFSGQVYGVGRGLDVADGAPCYPDLALIPEPVDVAFLALAADTTCDTLRQCQKAGVKVAIIGAAGFAESGDPEGIALQAQVGRVAQETGIRIVGPNCNGIYNANKRLSFGFNAAHSVRLQAGSIAILSHSGALFSVMAGYLEKMRAGISVFVSAGNELDLDLLDYLEYVLEDSETRVAALLLDAISDGERFRQLAERARQVGKRIVALKVGQSEIGAKAALAHSSRLAGDAASYAALFDACGVANTGSLEGLMTTAAMLSFYGRAQGGLGVFTTSGAGAGLVADLAARHHVPLAAVSGETQAKLTPYMQFSAIANPCDLGAFERGRSAEVPSIVAADPAVGALAAVVNPIDPNSGVITLTDDLGRASQSTGKPFPVIIPGGLPPEGAAEYERRGMRVFPDSECTFAALGALLAPAPEPILQVVASPRRDPRLKRLQDGGLWSEPESLALLAAYGINTVETVICTSVDQAAAVAERIGWPVVAKAVVTGVAHKTEAGLVRVGLHTADELRRAYADLSSQGAVIVQPMVRGRLELIAGVTWSSDVGTMLLAGLGGIYAEALRDVVMWAVPTTAQQIRRKLGDTGLGRILTSPRWPSKQSIDVIIEMLQKLQVLAKDGAGLIKAIDVNPLILTDDDMIAVDALVVPRERIE